MCQLPTVTCLQSTAYSHMPTVNCLQSYDEHLNVSTVYSHMPTVNCLQSYAYS